MQRRDVPLLQEEANLLWGIVVVTKGHTDTLWIPIPMTIDGSISTCGGVLLSDEAAGSHFVFLV